MHSFRGAVEDDDAPQGLAVNRRKFSGPEWNLTTFFPVFTNDNGPRPSIDGRGDTEMFDAKYNSLIDNTLFRIGINCALFLVWVGVAYGTLAAR